MDCQPEDQAPGGSPASRFVQVLYVGPFGSPELVAALRRDGVGVVAAFDVQRGAQLVQHFRPDAILCRSAELEAVLAFAQPHIPVIPLADETNGHADAATSRTGTVNSAALGARIRKEILANREDAGMDAFTARGRCLAPAFTDARPITAK